MSEARLNRCPMLILSDDGKKDKERVYKAQPEGWTFIIRKYTLSYDWLQLIASFLIYAITAFMQEIDVSRWCLTFN